MSDLVREYRETMHADVLRLWARDAAAELSRLSALVACRGDEINRMADAIDAARYAHPLHPRERPVPFAEADRTDREYAFRLARAAFAAITAPPVSQLKDTTNADK